MEILFRRLVKIYTCTIFLLSCTLTLQSLHAEWDPEYCLLDENADVLEDLKKQEFLELKSQILEGLKNSWCSAEKINLLLDLTLITRPKVCVEVGACIGSSVLPVAATLKYLKSGNLYAIDAWSNEVAVRNLDLDDANRAWWSTVNMNDIFSSYQHLINHFNVQDYCITIKKPSEVAVNDVDNIDFLHLDGDYSAVGSVQDVNLYLPKVRNGGYILISNIFTMVKGQAPKLKAFLALFESCDVVCEIERDNAVLFVKRSP